MGYDIILQREAQFFLPAAHVQQALQALLADRRLDCGGAKTLQEALQEAGGWLVSMDGSGNVVGLACEHDMLHDDMLWTLEAIAPYVWPGSYIVLEGEDGYIWRWYFDGQRVIEQEGKVVFDDPGYPDVTDAVQTVASGGNPDDLILPRRG